MSKPFVLSVDIELHDGRRVICEMPITTYVYFENWYLETPSYQRRRKQIGWDVHFMCCDNFGNKHIFMRNAIASIHAIMT